MERRLVRGKYRSCITSLGYGCGDVQALAKIKSGQMQLAISRSAEWNKLDLGSLIQRRVCTSNVDVDCGHTCWVRALELPLELTRIPLPMHGS